MESAEDVSDAGCDMSIPHRRCAAPAGASAAAASSDCWVIVSMLVEQAFVARSILMQRCQGAADSSSGLARLARRYPGFNGWRTGR